MDKRKAIEAIEKLGYIEADPPWNSWVRTSELDKLRDSVLLEESTVTIGVTLTYPDFFKFLNGYSEEQVRKAVREALRDGLVLGSKHSVSIDLSEEGRSVVEDAIISHLQGGQS